MRILCITGSNIGGSEEALSAPRGKRRAGDSEVAELYLLFIIMPDSVASSSHSDSYNLLRAKSTASVVKTHSSHGLVALMDHD